MLSESILLLYLKKMNRDQKGRFRKFKEEAEDFFDLCILAIKLIFIFAVFYFMFSYFDIASRIKDYIITVFLKDCEIQCKVNGKTSGYWDK